MKYIVSIFKNVKDVSNPFNKDVFYALDRIKSGKSKDKILWLRSLSKEDYDKHKNTLPSTCFNGSFSYRSEAGLKARSGLIILDFDNFDDFEKAVEFRNSLKSNEYVFAAWISPSGLGVKVLVKITTYSEHSQYFLALDELFDHPNWDSSGKDISRGCNESFDEDLYINPDSLIFDSPKEPEIEDISHQEVTLPASENLTIDNLRKWWAKKFGMNKGSRNANLFKLAAAFNSFGIHKSEAERILTTYQDIGFNQKEILTLIKSAYKAVDQFGTRFFEDTIEVEKIRKQVLTGTNQREIVKSSKHSEEAVLSCIEKVKSDKTIKDFWTYDEKGKISLVNHKYKYWLEQNNFFKYFPADTDTYSFIKIDQNLVQETNEKRIKDFVLDSLISRQDIGFVPYDFMTERLKYFSSDFLSLLESCNIEMKKDTKKCSYLYYKNTVVEVTENSIKEIDYIDIDGFIWKNQVNSRDFVRTDHHDSEYRKFIWLIADKNVEKYNSFKSVIGYLLHSFKTSANNKAIIFNDQTISENPNGGSGKGLFWNALGKMKKVSSIDGKSFEFSDRFPYQTVSTDTQLLVFDDVKRNFSFIYLFSLITEGITLEYKGQDAVRIPVEKSPKIIITTNYTIGGSGGSYDRRKFEVEMSDYFSSKHSPEDEFGHMMFDDWDDLEWSKFDNYMINCLQFYLKNGLVSQEFKNLEVRKFIKNTSFEFYEWIFEEEAILPDTRYAKGDLHKAFLEMYPDFNTNKFKLSIKRFLIWIKSYAEFKGLEYFEGNSNGFRWFSLSQNTNGPTETKAPF